MTRQNTTQTQQQTPTPHLLSKGGILQRKCESCGQHTIAGGECETCQKKNMSLQRYAINPAEFTEAILLVNEGGRGSSYLSAPVTQVPTKASFKHDFSQVPVSYSISRGIQTKLVLGRSDDIYEQEADRVAQELVRSRDSYSLEPINPSYIPDVPSGLIQRQEEVTQDVKTDDEDQLVEPVFEEPEGVLPEENEKIIGDETGRPKLDKTSSLPQPSPIRVPDGVGDLIEPNVRRFMEQRIGHDFSRVRIHTDSAAVDSAHQLGAHAYTVGTNVYFNEGRYDPRSTVGLKLLAHELAHVVQQTGSSSESSRIQSRIQLQTA